MYNKHTNRKIEFSVVVDNTICISFNTEKKQKEFIENVKFPRQVTCISKVSYPWNLQSGMHILV